MRFTIEGFGRFFSPDELKEENGVIRKFGIESLVIAYISNVDRSNESDGCIIFSISGNRGLKLSLNVVLDNRNEIRRF